MKVEVYKCRFTGQIYELDQKDKYVSDLKNLREKMKDKRKTVKVTRTFDNWLKQEKEKIVSVDMIVPWILENQHHLMRAYNSLKCTSFDRDIMYPTTDNFTEINLDVKYSSIVSNSHSCPKNGIRNWWGHEDKPKGYPGFQGRIEGTLSRKKNHMNQYPTSEFFKFLNINTGTGGGGNNEWGFDVKIFLEDWPHLGQEVVFKKLVNSI